MCSIVDVSLTCLVAIIVLHVRDVYNKFIWCNVLLSLSNYLLIVVVVDVNVVVVVVVMNVQVCCRIIIFYLMALRCPVF